MMKSWLKYILALAISFATPPAVAADTYDIHVIQSLTGLGAFLGQNEHKALEIEEKTLNRSGGIKGKPVRFVYHDDQSSPQIAIQLANEIIAEHPAVLLGSSLTATCSAIAPLMQQGPVMYCFSPAIHPAAGGYVFTQGASTTDLSNALLHFARLKGWTRIAIITSTDASGQDGERNLHDNLALPENAALKLVASVRFNTGDVSVAAQMEEVKAAKPQMLIAWTTGTPAATVFRGIVQAGIEIPVGSTAGNMTYAQMKQYAGFLPKDLYMPASMWPVDGDAQVPLDAGVAAKQREFYAAFAAEGLAPDEASTHPWDPAALIVEALRKLPDGADAAQLRDYLAHVKGAAGIHGVYDFEQVPQRGIPLADTVVTRWDAAANKWTIVAKSTGIPVDQ